ncbi:MAG: hypothetical protein ACFFER_13455, partial [Candidatus Thorarchaeota archaeon]
KSKPYVAGGRTLASCYQTHVYVEQTSMRITYTLVKPPICPIRREFKGKRVDFETNCLWKVS